MRVVHRILGSGAQITLIDQRNNHLFQPLLYQGATAILSISEIAWPIRELRKRRRDVTTLLARIDGVDADAKLVILDDGTRISCDTLVIAIGARHAYFGYDAWEEFAPGLKTLDDAISIRGHLLTAFEQAERETDPDIQRALLTFGVIGAGPTDVELAGIIAGLAKVSLPPSFRNVDTRNFRIHLIEAGLRMLSAFPQNMSAYTQAALVKRGVDVRTGVSVSACSAEGLKLGDAFIPCRTAIWAAGAAASPAALWLGVEGDRTVRVRVEADLTVNDTPLVFVIGDNATFSKIDGAPGPRTAPALKQQSSYIAGVIRARLKNEVPSQLYRYRHSGNLATIGTGAAVVHFGQLLGKVAWWFWGTTYIFFLIGGCSRAAVALNWLWTSLMGQHSARLITQGSSDESK